MFHPDTGKNLNIIETEEQELCVSKVPLFQGLNYGDQLSVAEVASPLTVTQDEHMYTAGSPVSQLMVVHTGSVKVARLDAEGREQILRVLGPGDFIGESAFLTGEAPHHFTVALEPSTMCVFRHADLERLVRLHPSIGLWMLREVSNRLAQTESRLASLLSGDVTSRLAEYLLNLPGAHTPEGTKVTLPLAKKDIASLLDTTPESVSRQLRRLTDSQIASAEGQRGLVIHDVDALMELAIAV